MFPIDRKPSASQGVGRGHSARREACPVLQDAFATTRRRAAAGLPAAPRTEVAGLRADLGKEWPTVAASEWRDAIDDFKTQLMMQLM